MQSIMFSTAARGTHIHRPATTAQPASAVDEPDDEESTTMVSPLALDVGSAVAGGSATVGNAAAAAIKNAIENTATELTAIGENVTSMDVDKDPVTALSSHPPSSTGTGKRSFSAMSASDADLELGTTNVTTPLLSDRSASGKKPNQGRVLGATISQPRSEPKASTSTSSTKVSPAAAMVGMQAQIVRLTDVFEKTMKKPEDGVATVRSLAIARLQDVDDGLSLKDKVKLIGLFQKDAIAAQTYLDLVHEEVRQAWLHSILDDD